MKYKKRIKCKECGKEIWKRGNRKYCKECTIIIRKKTIADWRKNNPEKFKKIREKTYLKYRKKYIKCQQERYNRLKPELSKYWHKRYKNIKTQGICVRCKIPLSVERRNKKNVMCYACTQKNIKLQNKLRKERRKHFLCVYCGKSIIIQNKYFLCEEHLLKTMARANTGSSKNWLYLKELLKKQNYKCIYSGRELIIGKNASIDHIIPKTKDGENSIENIQWVDRQVNFIKRDLNHQEFLSIIELIYNKIFIEK